MSSTRSMLTKSNSCDGVFMLLIDCVKASPCVTAEGKSLRHCALTEGANVSEDCAGLRKRYVMCKHGLLDMRSRIRGNKAV